MEPMVDNGKILVGTPLHRLSTALGDRQEGPVQVFAGDLADVSSACDPKSKVAADLRKQAGDNPGAKINVKAGELRELIGLAVGKKPAEKVEEKADA